MAKKPTVTFKTKAGKTFKKVYTSKAAAKRSVKAWTNSGGKVKSKNI